MSLLSLKKMSVSRRNRQILSDIDLTIEPGEIVGLIGANGAGKTTLMRAALGLLPATGQRSLIALNLRDRAKAAAWLPQAREVAWPVTVETLITLGRLPHLAAGQTASSQDRAAIETALSDMGLDALRNRHATNLSGGELGRVLIARTLAQEAPLLLTDEPIAGLDPQHQISTMQVFSGLAKTGKSVLVSIHDLGLAARHCSRLVLLGEGQIVADGPPAQVLTPQLMRRYFNITAHMSETNAGLVFQPLETVDPMPAKGGQT